MSMCQNVQMSECMQVNREGKDDPGQSEFKIKRFPPYNFLLPPFLSKLAPPFFHKYRPGRWRKYKYRSEFEP